MSAGLASVPSKAPGYCSRCEVQNPAGASRCQCGAAVVGNTLSVTHGRRRRKTLPQPQETELYQRYLSDLGGADRVTTGQLVILARLVEADMQAAGALAYMTQLQASGESFTSKRMNDARAAWAVATDRVLRGAALLGLERVPVKAASLRDYAKAATV
jgi:hypothetical protein